MQNLSQRIPQVVYKNVLCIKINRKFFNLDLDSFLLIKNSKNKI
jgi:hypothetical protein